MLRRLLPVLIVVVLAIVASFPAIAGSFLYDDHYYVLQNPAVSGDASVWTSPLGISAQSLWRPLTVASFRAQWEPGGGAYPYLLVNVLLHALASLLVFLLGRRLQLGELAAGLAATLFAVHPVHAEAVAWVTGRAELLATVGVLGAWLLYLSPRRHSAWLSAGLLALAALSKENALAAPGLLLAADLLLGRRVAWRRLALLAAVSAAVFAARAVALESLVPAEGPFLDTPLSGRVVVALNVVGQGLRLLAWPDPLRIDYHRDEFALARPDTWVILALLGLVVGLLWTRRRPAAAGLLLVPVSLVTVLHLVPIGEPFAERFLYLPSIPFCLAAGSLLAAWCSSEALSRRGLGASLLTTVAILVLGLGTTRVAVGVFKDDLTLWSHAAAATPDLPLPHYNLGRELDDRGLHIARDRDQPGCRDELARSLALEPRHAYAGFAHFMLGNHDLGTIGSDPPNPRAAADHFRAAVELLPTLAPARINLALIATTSEALVSRAEALRALDPLLRADVIDPDQRATVHDLARQLSGPASVPEATNGTSSPDGS